MKQVEFLVGVKAEQNLRDAVRAVTEDQDDEAVQLELCPVGRKDWVAGARLEGTLHQTELTRVAGEVLRRLLALGSHQRIREESVKVWAVPRPVPVFKDFEADSGATAEADDPSPPEPEPEPDSLTCTVCGRQVHKYNIHRDVEGRVVGCYFCGGVRGGMGR